MSEPFVINDRRGQKKEPRVDTPIILQPEETADKSSWQDVAYLTVLQPMPNNQFVVLGRAVGLRSDGRLLVADWAFPPLWTEDMQWQPLAKKRLDTFLGCGCSSSGPCATHKHYFQQWAAADQERNNAIGSAPLPPSLEILMKAEMARKQSKIVMPGRG